MNRPETIVVSMPEQDFEKFIDADQAAKYGESAMTLDWLAQWLESAVEVVDLSPDGTQGEQNRQRLRAVAAACRELDSNRKYIHQETDAEIKRREIVTDKALEACK
jgi:hypothetical protein